jgi:hypothetical protein
MIDHPSPHWPHVGRVDTEDGRTKIEIRLENETVWPTQQHMADLFQTIRQNISLHLRRKCFAVQTVLGRLQRPS